MARTSVKVEVTDLTDHDDEPMIEIPLVNRPQSLPRSSQNETSKRVNKARSENKGLVGHLDSVTKVKDFYPNFGFQTLNFSNSTKRMTDKSNAENDNAKKFK